MRSVSTLKYCLLATGFPMRTRVVGFMLGGYRICLLQKVYYFTLFSPPIEHSVAVKLCGHALCKYVEILSTGHRVPDAYTCGRFHVRRISNLPATKSLLLYIILSSYTITPAHYAEPHRNS